MVYISKALAIVAAFALLGEVVGHPGHDLDQEIAERSAFYQTSKRDLSHCYQKLRKRGVLDKQIKRRQAKIFEERTKRGLTPECALAKRDDATSTSHLSSLDVTPDTTNVDSIIFGNSSCLLSPEGEEGPYYVKGEYIRSDIRESEPGVEIIVDLHFIDIETCEPIENLTADIWHCNSTGVYSGVVANGNGDNTDLTNLNATYLRGLQTTDADGVAQYTSVFPGHYSGRATHVHVESHLNGTFLENGTYSGGTIAHIGQFFFDQDLISQVEALSPYSENTVSITENSADRVIESELTNGADPFLNYVLLGNNVTEGLFMWVTLGVNTTASYTASPASILTEEGGVVNTGGGTGAVSGGTGAGMSGNGTFGGGNGTMPSGTMPSGTMQSGAVAGNSTGIPSGAVIPGSSTNSGSATAISTAAIPSVTETSGARRRYQLSYFL